MGDKRTRAGFVLLWSITVTGSCRDDRLSIQHNDEGEGERTESVNERTL